MSISMDEFRSIQQVTPFSIDHIEALLQAEVEYQQWWDELVSEPEVALAPGASS